VALLRFGGAARAAAAHQHLSLSLKALEQEQAQAQQRHFELMRLNQQLHHDEQREQALMAENDAMLVRLAAEEQELQAAVEDFIAEQEERQASLEEWETQLSQAEDQLQSLNQRKAETNAYIEQNRRQRHETAVKKERLEQAIGKVEAELETLRLEMSIFDHLEDRRLACQEMTAILQLWEEEMSVLEEAVIQAREEAQSAQAVLSQIQMR